MDLVLSTPGITQEEVDELYEDYRYGTRPTLYLYLLPSIGSLIFDSSRMQQAYDEISEAEESNDSEGVGSHEDADGSILVQDVEAFDGITELHLTYVHTLRYIDTDDNPASVQELRHAFLWVSTTDHFVVVLSRDQSIARPSVQALTRVLGYPPQGPSLARKRGKGFYALRMRLA
jgi:hypothetical protein